MGSTVTTRDPATGQELATYDAMDAAAIDDAVAAATSAGPGWSATPVADRADRLLALADALRADREELAAVVTREMGKPLREARGEVDKCAWVCEYYAAEGPAVLADREVAAGEGRSWVSHEPLGVVLAVMPWNFPLWQVLRFAAPTLLAGNTALCKHAPSTTGTSLRLAEVFAGAGLGDGVFDALVVAEDDVGDVVAGLLADDRIAGASVTGSGRAGSAVAAAAGANCKPSLLELGGSDPLVVLADADLDAAVDAAVTSRFLNAGQSCLAAKRLIVAAAVHEQFCDLLVERVEQLVVGDPAEDATDVGPMAREDLRTELAALVDRSVSSGATVRTGGHALDRSGWFYAPTVLTEVTVDMPVMVEETFGPVAVVVPAADDDAAARLADETSYGLGAAVWSADVDRALAVGRRITSGALFVNAVVASDPRLPFGGTRRSGYGRELGHAGLHEFVNLRTWHVG